MRCIIDDIYSYGRQCCKEVNSEETLICPHDETSLVPDKAPKFCQNQDSGFCETQPNFNM